MVHARRVLGSSVVAALSTLGLALTSSCGPTETSQATVQESTVPAAATAQSTPESSDCVVPSAPGSEYRPPTEAEQVSKRQVIAEVLDPAFGQPTKGPTNQLSKGFVGLAVDRTAATYVAVVDSTQVDVARLDEQLRSAGAAADPPVKFQAQAACFSSAELEEAAEVLRAGKWHPRAKTATKAWSLAAEDSSYHVDVTDAAVADALVQRLGKRVTITDD